MDCLIVNAIIWKQNYQPFFENHKILIHHLWMVNKSAIFAGFLVGDLILLGGAVGSEPSNHQLPQGLARSCACSSVSTGPPGGKHWNLREVCKGRCRSARCLGAKEWTQLLLFKSCEGFACEQIMLRAFNLGIPPSKSQLWSCTIIEVVSHVATVFRQWSTRDMAQTRQL